MADYNSDRTGSNIDAVLDKADNLTQAAVGVGGNVGIGTASPSEKLESVTTDNTQSALSLYEKTIGGESKLDFKVRNNAGNPIVMARISSQMASGTVGSESAHLKLQTTSAGTNQERARIDSSGNLLVGKTSLNGNTTGFQVEPAGAIAVTRNGSTTAYFNRQTNDGEIVAFRKDGATVGSIGSYSGILTIGHGDVGLTFSEGGDSILPINQNTNTLRDDAIQLGDATRRFKDLYLSGGVYLGGTGAANKLDDYEEGAWTPTNNGDSTGTVTSTGSYTKVGKQVTVQGVIRIDSNFDGAAFAGLPFAPSGNSDVSSVRGIFNTFSDSRDLYIRLLHGTTLFNVYLDLKGTPAYPATADGSIRFLMSYETNA